MEITSKRDKTVFFFYLGMATVALLSFCFYLGTLQHYFVADDFIFLSQLQLDQPNFWDSFAYFGRDWGMGSLFYRPLIRVIWAAEYILFGKNPVGWHFVGVLLYGATAALVYLLTWLLSHSLKVAFLAGLFFSLHPIHCEAVTWISDQSDLLAALFCLASAIFYLQAQQLAYRDVRHLLPLYYSLALSCFILALTSKESALGFFLVPMAYELILFLFSSWRVPWRYLGHNLLRIVIWQIPFWVTLAFYIMLRLVLFGGMGGYSGNQPTEIKLTSTEISLYLGWLFNPVSSETAAINYLAVAAAILVLSLIVFSWHDQVQAKRTAPGTPEKLGRSLTFSIIRTILFSLCWIVCFILPTLPAPSARLVYLSTIGVAMLVAALLAPFGNLVSAKVDFTRLTTPQKLAVTTKTRLIPAINNLKILLIIVVLVLSAQGMLIKQNLWWQASQVTSTTLKQLPEIYPNLRNNSQVYAVGLINNPQPGHPAALVYGFPEAVQLTYDNQTLWGFSVEKFPDKVEERERSYFIEYKDGRLLPREESEK